MIKMDYFLGKDVLNSSRERDINQNEYGHLVLDFNHLMNNMLRPVNSELKDYFKLKGKYIKYFFPTIYDLKSEEVCLEFKIFDKDPVVIYMDSAIANVFKGADKIYQRNLKEEENDFGITWTCFLISLFRNSVGNIENWLLENDIDSMDAQEYFCEERLHVNECDVPYDCKKFLRKIDEKELFTAHKNISSEMVEKILNQKNTLFVNSEKGRDNLGKVKDILAQIHDLTELEKAPDFELLLLDVESMMFNVFGFDKINTNRLALLKYLETLGSTILVISQNSYDDLRVRGEKTLKYQNLIEYILKMPNVKVIEEIKDVEHFSKNHLRKFYGEYVG